MIVRTRFRSENLAEISFDMRGGIQEDFLGMMGPASATVFYTSIQERKLGNMGVEFE